MPSGIRQSDFTDKPFGLLTLRKRFIRNSKAYWECDCVCGESVVRREDHLVRDKDRVKFSCGCYMSDFEKTGKFHKRWRGHGDISGACFAGMRCGAEKRNIPFNLTIEYVWNLFVEQDQKCAVSGLPLRFHAGGKRDKVGNQTASLDRIDPSLGYIEGNVQWVHKTINLMRHHYDLETFYAACNAVTKKNPRRVNRKLIDEAKGTRNASTGRRPVTLS